LITVGLLIAAKWKNRASRNRQQSILLLLMFAYLKYCCKTILGQGEGGYLR